MTWKDEARSSRQTLMQHDLNQTQAIVRGWLAKGLGLPESDKFASPFTQQHITVMYPPADGLTEPSTSARPSPAKAGVNPWLAAGATALGLTGMAGWWQALKPATAPIVQTVEKVLTRDAAVNVGEVTVEQPKE